MTKQVTPGEDVMVKAKPSGINEGHFQWPGAPGGCPETERHRQYAPTLWRVLWKYGKPDRTTRHLQMQKSSSGSSQLLPVEGRGWVLLQLG